MQIRTWFQNIFQWIKRKLRWLLPGLGVKRWLLLILLGTTLLGLGFAVLVLDVYRNAPDTWWLPILSYLSLRFLARPLRALIFGGIGLALVGWGVWGLNRALLGRLPVPVSPSWIPSPPIASGTAVPGLW